MHGRQNDGRLNDGRLHCGRLDTTGTAAAGRLWARGMAWTLLCVVSLLWPVFVSGQLQWEQTSAHVEIGAPDDPWRVVAEYRFTNDGDYPLSIRKLTPLGEAEAMGVRATVVLDPIEGKRSSGRGRTVEVGQSGAVKVYWNRAIVFEEYVFEVGVRTDEGLKAQQALPTLMLRVTPPGWDRLDDTQRRALLDERERLRGLPVPVEVVPRMLAWGPEETEAKTVTVALRGVDAEDFRGMEDTRQQELREARPGFKTTGFKTERLGVDREAGDEETTVAVRVSLPEISGDEGFNDTRLRSARLRGRIASMFEAQVNLEGDLLNRQRMAGKPTLVARQVSERFAAAMQRRNSSRGGGDGTAQP